MFEIKDFPKRHAEVEKTKTGHCTSDPSGSDYTLQSVESSFPGRVKEKVVVAPIAQPEKTLRNPGEQSEQDADFQAENDVEDDA